MQQLNKNAGRIKLLSVFFLMSLFPLAHVALCKSPDAKNILRISQPVDFAATDPAMATSVEDTDILEQIYERLTEYDPKSALPVPGCVKGWEISKDLKTYTFTIIKNAKWSDGDDLKAGDFVFAWKRILTKETGSPWAYMLFNIKNAKEYYEGKIEDFSKVGIRASGDKTFIVDLNEPQPYFLAWLSHASMSPYKEGKSLIGDRDFIRSGIVASNGPFILRERKPKERVMLVPNRFYWDKGKVSLDEVHFIPTTDENTGIRMYETGLLDIHGGGISSAKVTELLKSDDMQSAPYIGTYFYRFNTAKKPFDDRRIRTAFNMAVNKRVIAEKVMRGGQLPAFNLIPPGISWYESAKGDDYDPGKARDILDLAGFCVPDRLKVACNRFPEVEILFNTQGNHRLIAEAIQSMLRENLMVDRVKLINTDFKTARANEADGKYFMARGGWVGDFLDPSTFLSLWTKDSGNNRTGWSNIEYEDLLKRADSTLGQSERARLLNKAEQILNDEVPFMPIYFYVKNYLKKGYVKGYYKNLLSKHPLKSVYLAR